MSPTPHQYLDAGLATIPIRDGQKTPRIAQWRSFQTAPPTHTDVDGWIENANGNRSWAIICGTVSGGLEVIDFDEKYSDGICKRWYDHLPPELQTLVSTLPMMKTMSGGYHVYYRCDTVEGNQKLAVNSEGVMIETRGEGGYVLAPPSPNYTLLRGDLLNVPRITVDEREALLGWARALNEYVPDNKIVRPEATDGTRPGDIFNATTDWKEILEPQGWKLMHCRDGECYWQRPGKKDAGVSATTNYNGSDLMYLFSTSVPGLESEQAYSKFSLYTILHHGGDYKEAARVLSKKMPDATKAELLAADTLPKAVRAGMELRCLSDVQIRPIDWLWEGKLARGKVTLLAGNPGLGKSQLSLHIAACVSNNTPFPEDIMPPTHGGSVLILSAEDTPEDVLVPRLMACGANLDNIHIIEAVRDEDGNKKGYDLVQDMQLLDEAATRLQDLSLVIIDPISAYLGETDSHKNAEVRAVMSRLTDIAAARGFAVLAVTHLNKNSSSDSIGRFMGSLAFVAAARAAFIVVKDSYDESRRLFLPAKNNLAEDTGGLMFHLEGTSVGKYNEVKTSRVVFDGIADINVNDALQNERGTNNGNKKELTLDRAKEWLYIALKDYPQGVLVETLKTDADFEDISMRTLSRAAHEMGIEKVGPNQSRLWKLPLDYGKDTE